MKRFLMSTLGLLALSGCAAFSRSDPFMQIQPGMEAAQVQSLLGSPMDRKFVGEHDEWTYRKDMGRGIQKTKVIVFDNQKVVALADDAVSAQREFELAKARASAAQYPGVPGAPATTRAGQPTAPQSPALTAGSPMVLPPNSQQAAAAPAPAPQAPVANQPVNPSVGTSSAAPQPPAPATEAAKPNAPAPTDVKPQPPVPPSAELAPPPVAEEKVVQQKAKKPAKKAKRQAKHHPITEPKTEESR